MKRSLTIIFLMTSLFCFSQNKMLDSLENVIKNYGKEDTTYVNLRIKYVARKMFLTPADTTWTAYVNKTLDISNQLNYPKGIGISYNNLGIIQHYFLSNPLEGLEY